MCFFFKFHYPKEAPISPEISKNYKDLATNKKMAAKSMQPALKSVAPYINTKLVCLLCMHIYACYAHMNTLIISDFAY